MDIKSKLWYELSSVEFSNIELLLLHGYICLALRHPLTTPLPSRDSMLNIRIRIEDHLKGLELLSENDINFIKTQEDIFHL